MNKKVIYIAGYGRSGSTVLERVLGSNNEIFATGELCRLPTYLERESCKCACGESLKKCNFWGEVWKELKRSELSSQQWERVQDKNEDLIHFSKLLKQTNSAKGLYVEIMERLFRSIFEHLPNQINYIIDSSKTARENFFRPLDLSRLVGLDVRVIHLVRDGRGCIWSNLKGSNRKMERGTDPHIPFAALRTALSWPLANISPHIFAHCEGREKYLRVRYEDFVNHTRESLNRIGSFIDVDLTQQIEMLRNNEPLPRTHQLAGNRMRKEKAVELKEDTEWKSSLKPWHRLLFWFIDWPWAFKYGYGF